MRKILISPAFLSVAFFATVLLTSCQKDVEEAPPSCQQTVAGLSGTYKISAMKYRASSSSPEQDWLPLMPVCERDNTILLFADGTYSELDLETVCSPSSSESGTWSLSGTTIISDGEIAGRIESYDCQKLVVSTPDVIIPGDKVILTLQKQ